MTQLIYLDDRAVIRLRGKDTHKLLQGLITNTMDKLHGDGALYSALLSPQGKYLYDFFLKQYGDDIYCDIARSDADGFLKKLSMYRLRADVSFELMPEHYVLSQPDYPEPINTLDSQIHFSDPRMTVMGGRHIVSTLPEHTAPAEAYHHLRIMHGIAEGAYDAVKDSTLLLEMGFDALGAIDFHKGCYVGQEVTARTKYRANIRRRIYILEADKPFDDSSIDIIAGESIIGERRSFSGNLALGLLHSEKLDEAINAGHDICCGAIKLKISLPEFAR